MGKRQITTFTSLQTLPSRQIPNPATPSVANLARNEGFYATPLTTAQRNAIPASMLRNGAFIYNTDVVAGGGVGAVQFYQQLVWTTLAPGNGVAGPAVSTIGNIAIWDNTTGTLLANSLVDIIQLVPALESMPHKEGSLQAFSPDIVVNEIGNLGHIRFNNSGGVGTIYVDTLVGMQFFDNNYSGPNNQICTLISGGLPESSTNPYCIFEIQTTTGAMVVSRMTTTQINAMTPTVGMVAYNTTTGRLTSYESGSWISSYAPGKPTTIIDTWGGTNSFFIGTFAGNSTATGVDNIALSSSSLSSVTTGSANLAIGGLHALTTGSGCIAIGNDAMELAVSTVNCVAVGAAALSNNVSGGQCVAIGGLALAVATTNFNVAIGDQAGRYITTGTDNTCVGNLSGPAAANATWSGNTYLGSGATIVNNGVNNSTVIGYNTVASISNAVILGTNCSAGIGTTQPLHGLHIAKGAGNAISPRIYLQGDIIPSDPATAGDGIYAVNNGDPYFASGTAGKSGFLMRILAYGSSIIISGSSSLQIFTSAIRANSIIFLSSTLYNSDPAPAQVLPNLTSGGIIAGDKFVVFLDQISAQNIYVNWMIINP